MVFRLGTLVSSESLHDGEEVKIGIEIGLMC